MHEETWWEIFTDPNHIKAELLWTLIQDGLIAFLLWGKVIKKIVHRITKHVHHEIDKSHGYEHNDKH
jgi:uracil DNA glycosylase